MSHKIPRTTIQSVKQGLYLSSFESRDVKIQGKCASITRAFSTTLFNTNHQVFLKNLTTSSELHERLAQGKQISPRKEKEIFALSKLLEGFQAALDSPTSSLPSSSSHTKSYKTLEDLHRYIRQEMRGDFAIHLVTINHVVAIYRKRNQYAYFDSNVAFVQGSTTGPTLVDMGDQCIKNVDMNGLLTSGTLLARKWTGYRPKTAKARPYDLAIDKNGINIELSIQSHEFVNAFMDKVQEHAQACGMQEATSSILKNPKLYTQAVEIVRKKLVTGEEVEAIAKLLCDKIVKPNIKNIASASIQVQANYQGQHLR